MNIKRTLINRLPHTVEISLRRFRRFVYRKVESLAAKPRQYRLRRNLKNRNFTVISNNCWAAMAIYQQLGIRYNTPTVGLFFSDEDYLKFLENLDYYLNQPLVFVNPCESKLYGACSVVGDSKINFPIARLDDVELLCVHYKSEQEVLEKWERRKARINFSNLIVKASIRDLTTDCDDYIRRLGQLPYRNKICFSPNISAQSWVITVPELLELNTVGGDETPILEKYIDVVDLLNKFENSHNK